MWTRRLMLPFLAVLVAAAWEVSAAAQTIPLDNKKDAGPSHIEVPFRPGAHGQFADFLKSRDHAREAAEAYKQLQELLKTLPPEEQKKLPKKLLNEDGELNPDAELTEEEVRQLQEQLKQYAMKSYQGVGGGGSSQGIAEALRKFKESGAQFKPQEPPQVPEKADVPPSPDRPRSEGQSQPIPPVPERSNQEKQQELQKNLTNWWDKVKSGPLGSSETLRDLGRKLSQPIGGNQGTDSDGLVEKLQRMGGSLPFKDFFSRLPSFSRSDRSGGSPASTPSLGGGDTGTGGAMMGVVWTGMVIIVIALLWKLLTDRRTALAVAGLSGWRLGPWPVDPAQVTTRQDLIRAFEYLSLLRFGRAARSWNHRAIAKRLSDQSAEAAQHLAILYEKARYAPPADPLPDEEVRDARRDLCLLAGVAHA